MLTFFSGRLQTVQLKATPTAEAPKDKSGPKGSWGKPGAAKKAAPAAAAADGTRVIRSNATAGFDIPVSTSMFTADRI